MEPAERTDALLEGIRNDVPRQFVVDLQDRLHLAASQAKRVVMDAPDGADVIQLTARRGHKAVGLVRHQIYDQAFEHLAVRHGGELIGHLTVLGDGGKPTDRRLYVTIAKFGGTHIGFASHREREDLPIKNQSRKLLFTMNRGLGDDLFAKLEGFSDRDRFAIFMVQRDLRDVGKIASITLGMADPSISQFLMQADINQFLAGYGTKKSPTGAVKLKGTILPFRERNKKKSEPNKGAK